MSGTPTIGAGLKVTIITTVLATAGLALTPGAVSVVLGQGQAAPADLPRNAAGWTAIVDGKPVAAPDIPMGDDEVVKRIIEEAKNRNQVMDHLRHLSEVIGARLTGSAACEAANRWCMEQYEKWGLTNIHLDQWGEIATRFDRGPSSANVLLRRERDRDGEKVVEYETMREMQFSTLAWTTGTDGPVRGKVVKEPKTHEEFDAVKDKLAGAWVLVEAPPPIGQRGIRNGLSARYELRNDARRKASEGVAEAEMAVQERVALQPVLGYISCSRDERVWTGGAPGWRERKLEDYQKDVHISARLSDYDFINSRLADGEPIEVEIDLKHTLKAGPIPVYNTVAEIPGTKYPHEVIIISGHLDTWDGPGSQGTTDNGTGTAVTLEAARLLIAAGAKPDRTIRFIHWTGEEQGLLGSREYVNRQGEKLANISACFVDDGGTNTQGGAPCQPFQVEYLAAATAPTNFQFYSETDGKWLNVNIRGGGGRSRGGGGSDHASFNARGVPGFFWDEVGRADYGYGWHTQHDRIDLAIPEYLKQSAMNSAIVAYRLACAPALLPRKGPEEAEAPAAGGGEGAARGAGAAASQ